MPRIFISYSRLDSGQYAGRIADRLKAVFGDENVFKDSYNIPAGADFRGAIREEVGKADVVLALIGPDWLPILEQRLSRSQDDWVKLEIETGLQRTGVLVIPVLLNGTPIPPAHRLPDTMRELSYRNGFPLRVDDPYFGRDINNLISDLKLLDAQNTTAQPQTTATSQQGNGNGGVNRLTVWIAVIGAVATIAAAAIGILPDLLAPSASTPTEAPTPTLTATTAGPTDTPEPPTITPTMSATLTETAIHTPTVIVTATAPPPTLTETLPAPTITVTSASSVGAVQLTLYRDEDSFTLFAPAGSNLSNVVYSVTTQGGEQTFGIETYAGFVGLPFSSLPQAVCFRLVRSGGTRPVPQNCQGETLLLTHQLANADVFWRDGSAGLDRTVLVYQGANLLGACGAGQSACPVVSGGVSVVFTATSQPTATQVVRGYPCEGVIVSRSSSLLNVVRSNPSDSAPLRNPIEQGSRIRILRKIEESQVDVWYQIANMNNVSLGWVRAEYLISDTCF